MTKTQLQRRLETLDALLDPAVTALEELVGELEEQVDGKSERWRESEAGAPWVERRDALAERLDSLRGVQETVQGYLEEVW